MLFATESADEQGVTIGAVKAQYIMVALPLVE